MSIYRHSDPTCNAGPLIPKRRAPKCAICGRVLWTAVHKDYKAPMHNANGERLGYVPSCRGLYWRPNDTRLRCWNSKACEKRKQKGGA